MKHLFVILIIAFLFSCNKSERNARWMDGTWNIYSYAQITAGGFVTYFPAKGTISFRDSGGGNMNVEENFVYYTSTDTINVQRSGTLIISGKKGMDINITFNNPIEVEMENEMMHLLTRDDLKFEYRENGIGSLFVLQND